MASQGALGPRLRELRVLRGLSQEELALRVGTSQPAIARYEAGAAEPRLETLQRIAGALGYARLGIVFRELRP